jgi:DNA mismatch repair protein MutS
MTQSITEEYFQLTHTYTEKYGKRTIVLLQVGAFFEVYGIKNSKSNIISNSQIEEFANICQLTISEKNASSDSNPIMMAGFRDYTLEKYLQKLTENDYTAVVYIQEKNGKTVSRKFHAVYSPGTFISYDTESCQTITNNIMFDTMKRRVKIVIDTNPLLLLQEGGPYIFEYRDYIQAIDGSAYQQQGTIYIDNYL